MDGSAKHEHVSTILHDHVVMEHPKFHALDSLVPLEMVGSPTLIWKREI